MNVQDETNSPVFFVPFVLARAKASILVGVLWCLALLSVIVIGVLHTARLDLLVEKNYGDRIQAHYLALAGIEKAKALLYQNARDRSRSGKNHSGELYDAAQQFRDVPFGRGKFRIFRRGREDEGGGIIYGISDEESRLNVNQASTNELAKLQGMTPDVAAAIIDWRDEDNEVTPGGAEAEYYSSLQPPYLPRNGPLQTVRELLMVRGISSELLFGKDADQNGLLGAAEDDRENSSTADQGGVLEDAGWSGVVTVDSSVKNLNAAGQSRVYVQSADEKALTAVKGITSDIAQAIIAYRNQNQLDNLGKLLDVTAAQNGNRPGQNNNQGPKVISEDLFRDIADDVTADSGQDLPGLVNINTASLAVLICLPGIDRELAQATHFVPAIQRLLPQHRLAVQGAGHDAGHLQAGCSARHCAIGNVSHHQRGKNHFHGRAAANSGDRPRRIGRHRNIVLPGGLMKGFDFMKSPCLCVEIGQSSLKVLNGDSGLDLVLDRMENGGLTDPCQERVRNELGGFLKRQSWQPRMVAFCAIGARGVSLRRLTLPAAGGDELQRLLRLQIESEFPLPPDELAWGYARVDAREPSGNTAARQELLVAAVKKEAVEGYSDLLAGCGISPVFTLAALARNYVCPQPSGSHAILDIGPNHSELAVFEQGCLASVRTFPWGETNITQSIQEKLGIGPEDAEKLKLNPDHESSAPGECGQMIQDALGAALDSLGAMIKGNWNTQKLYLSGKGVRQKDLPARLARSLGAGVECVRLETPPGEGRSAAILGLKRACENDGSNELLTIQVKETKHSVAPAWPAPWRWAALAVVLAIGALSLPYAEALLMKPRLAARLAEVKGNKGRLAVIDREFNFLQYLKKNQAPYLDAIYLLANAAPGGTRIDSLSMNQRGELSLRGSMRTSEQVGEFRAKLIDSGFFSSVVVEEQSPTPDRQKVNIRITGEWKPAVAREALSIGPSLEPEKSKTGAKGTNSSAAPDAKSGTSPTPKTSSNKEKKE